MKKIKEKWGINSNFQLLIILIVFSIAGSLALIISEPLLHKLGIIKNLLSPWIFWPLRILIVFISYQFIILAVGALFGQFRFFWNFEKKMLVPLGFKKLKDTK